MNASIRNKIYHGDAIKVMAGLPEESVDMVITSPPYNVGIKYGNEVTDAISPTEYQNWMMDVLGSIKRILKPDGRIALNVGNTGRKPYVDLNCLFNELFRLWGFRKRGDIIWDKTIKKSCAWGSYNNASNPSIVDVHEYIGVFDKGEPKKHQKGVSTQGRFKFPELVESVWRIGAENGIGRQVHPAPFPVEIPERLMHLYTYEGDLVLDPFVGSGTTAVACKRTKRDYIGIDTNSRFLEYAKNRLENEVRLFDLEEYDGRP